MESAERKRAWEKSLREQLLRHLLEEAAVGERTSEAWGQVGQGIEATEAIRGWQPKWDTVIAEEPTVGVRSDGPTGIDCEVRAVVNVDKKEVKEIVVDGSGVKDNNVLQDAIRQRAINDLENRFKKGGGSAALGNFDSDKFSQGWAEVAEGIEKQQGQEVWKRHGVKGIAPIEFHGLAEEVAREHGGRGLDAAKEIGAGLTQPMGERGFLDAPRWIWARFRAIGFTEKSGIGADIKKMFEEFKAVCDQEEVALRKLETAGTLKAGATESEKHEVLLKDTDLTTKREAALKRLTNLRQSMIGRFKHIAPEQRAALADAIDSLIWDFSLRPVDNAGHDRGVERENEIKQVIKEHADLKVSGMQAIKSGVDTALVVSGFFTGGAGFLARAGSGGAGRVALRGQRVAREERAKLGREKTAKREQDIEAKWGELVAACAAGDAAKALELEKKFFEMHFAGRGRARIVETKADDGWLKKIQAAMTGENRERLLHLIGTRLVADGIKGTERGLKGKLETEEKERQFQEEWARAKEDAKGKGWWKKAKIEASHRWIKTANWLSSVGVGGQTLGIAGAAWGGFFEHGAHAARGVAHAINAAPSAAAAKEAAKTYIGQVCDFFLRGVEEQQQVLAEAQRQGKWFAPHLWKNNFVATDRVYLRPWRMLRAAKDWLWGFEAPQMGGGGGPAINIEGGTEDVTNELTKELGLPTGWHAGWEHIKSGGAVHPDDVLRITDKTGALKAVVTGDEVSNPDDLFRLGAERALEAYQHDQIGSGSGQPHSDIDAKMAQELGIADQKQGGLARGPRLDEATGKVRERVNALKEGYNTGQQRAVSGGGQRWTDDKINESLMQNPDAEHRAVLESQVRSILNSDRPQVEKESELDQLFGRSTTGAQHTGPGGRPPTLEGAAGKAGPAAAGAGALPLETGEGTRGGEVQHESIDAQEYLNRHRTELHTVRVHGRDWLDQDTGMPDQNEQRLDLIHKSDGTYAFSVKHMLPEGSFHGKLSVDPLELARKGELNVYVSVSHGTQTEVIPLHVNEHLEAPVPPELAKVIVGGSGKFQGAFAEAAKIIQGENGQDRLLVFATAEGKGLKEVVDTVTTAPQEYLPVSHSSVGHLIFHETGRGGHMGYQTILGSESFPALEGSDDLQVEVFGDAHGTAMAARLLDHSGRVVAEFTNEHTGKSANYKFMEEINREMWRRTHPEAPSPETIMKQAVGGGRHGGSAAADIAAAADAHTPSGASSEALLGTGRYSVGRESLDQLAQQYGPAGKGGTGVDVASGRAASGAEHLDASTDDLGDLAAKQPPVPAAAPPAAEAAGQHPSAADLTKAMQAGASTEEQQRIVHEMFPGRAEAGAQAPGEAGAAEHGPVGPEASLLFDRYSGELVTPERFLGVSEDGKLLWNDGQQVRTGRSLPEGLAIVDAATSEPVLSYYSDAAHGPTAEVTIVQGSRDMTGSVFVGESGQVVFVDKTLASQGAEETMSLDEAIRRVGGEQAPGSATIAKFDEYLKQPTPSPTPTAEAAAAVPPAVAPAEGRPGSLGIFPKEVGTSERPEPGVFSKALGAKRGGEVKFAEPTPTPTAEHKLVEETLPPDPTRAPTATVEAPPVEPSAAPPAESPAPAEPSAIPPELGAIHAEAVEAMPPLTGDMLKGILKDIEEVWHGDSATLTLTHDHLDAIPKGWEVQLRSGSPGVPYNEAMVLNPHGSGESLYKLNMESGSSQRNSIIEIINNLARSKAGDAPEAPGK